MSAALWTQTILPRKTAVAMEDLCQESVVVKCDAELARATAMAMGANRAQHQNLLSPNKNTQRFCDCELGTWCSVYKHCDRVSERPVCRSNTYDRNTQSHNNMVAF